MHGSHSQIDLDTIETSNLNRQFLFRKHHVGMSKAKVAAEVIRTLKPQVRITAHHANIKVMVNVCGWCVDGGWDRHILLMSRPGGDDGALGQGAMTWLCV
jgi:hypothetical protein